MKPSPQVKSPTKKKSPFDILPGFSGNSRHHHDHREWYRSDRASLFTENPELQHTNRWLLAVLWLLLLAIIHLFIQISTRRISKENIELTDLLASLEKSNSELAVKNAERDQLEKILERGKREWEAIFDAVQDAVLVTDKNGLIIRCNRSATRWLNKRFDELVDDPYRREFWLEMMEMAPRATCCSIPGMRAMSLARVNITSSKKMAGMISPATRFILTPTKIRERSLFSGISANAGATKPPSTSKNNIWKP